MSYFDNLVDQYAQKFLRGRGSTTRWSHVPGGSVDQHQLLQVPGGYLCQAQPAPYQTPRRSNDSIVPSWPKRNSARHGRCRLRAQTQTTVRLILQIETQRYDRVCQRSHHAEGFPLLKGRRIPYEEFARCVLRNTGGRHCQLLSG